MTGSSRSDIVLQVFVPVGLAEYEEHCGAGCHVFLFLFGVIATMPLCVILYGAVRYCYFCQYPGACFNLVLSIYATLAQMFFSIVAMSVLASKWNDDDFTSGNRAWLALSSIGFFLDGMLEFVAYTYHAVSYFWEFPDCEIFSQDFLEEFFETFAKDGLANNGEKAMYLGSFLEMVFLHMAFCVVATVLTQDGWIAWIVSIVFDILFLLYNIKDREICNYGCECWDDYCGCLSWYPSRQVEILFFRAVEALLVAFPLLTLEAMSKGSIGMVSLALLARDAFEIVEPAVQFYCACTDESTRRKKRRKKKHRKNKHRNNVDAPTRRHGVQQQRMRRPSDSEEVVDQESQHDGSNEDSSCESSGFRFKPSESEESDNDNDDNCSMSSNDRECPSSGP